MMTTLLYLKSILFRRPELRTFFSKRRFYCTSVEQCEVNVTFSNGNSLTLSSSQYARLADGCALGQIGNTTVMVTAVSKVKPPTSSPSFVPLIVDYRQKAAAAGRIPTNFLRREKGPTDHEILVGRLIDRALRPLFPTGFVNDTQIICNLLAVDGINDPDVASINAASAALYLSDIPWNGPIGAVRVGKLGDELIVNPTRHQLVDSLLNLIVVSAGHNLVVMLEGKAKNVMQHDFLKAVKFGVKECQNVIQSLQTLHKHAKPKREYTSNIPNDENVIGFIELLAEPKLKEILLNTKHDKMSRDMAVNAVQVEIMDKIKKEVETNTNVDSYCSMIFGRIFKKLFRSLILEQRIRCDGRDMDQLRDISCKVDLYQPLHGSALFQRGQTQVLCTVALDSLDSALKLDPMSILSSGLKEKNFFLHYDFPPYAVNEIGRGSADRREIGHGALAEKALVPVIPSNYPFTIRLTSEVLESNGSSSMASVCGGSMALMDAGVPISMPVAGVAIGLVTDFQDDPKKIEKYELLTDILGIEDYLGDMDFKMAASKKGITAIQADIKLPGIPLKIIMEAIEAAYKTNSKIIDIMNANISKPREKQKICWPVIDRLEVEPHKRGKLLGPGGIHLKKLMMETGVHVNQDDNIFTIFAPNKEALAEAKEQIDKILKESNEPQLEFGGIYKAKIVEIREIGVMVTLYDLMVPALLHNLQLDQRKIRHPEALGFKVGDEIYVKYFGRDPVSGAVRLSRKVLHGPASGVVQNLKP